MSAEEQPEPPFHQIHSRVSPLVPKDVPPGAARKMPDDPAKAAMYKLLGARLRCTMSDGRTATGTFICLDRLRNMILMDVVEERFINPAHYGNTKTKVTKWPVTRELSQAMVPGKHLVKVEIEKEHYKNWMMKYEII